ncbi:MAG: hypothetical protein HUK21_03945 [Fibrobacteraceae bacterium]|nr:hypothetical protein [Fibrobacteraceae bacterium]
MILKPNMNWTANQNIEQPTVLAEYQINDHYFVVNFTVEEPLNCFRAEVEENNGKSWEDSCVEIFLENPADPSEYFNFEITSRGFLLAARGKSREGRQILDESLLKTVLCQKVVSSLVGNLICWGMQVHIPATLFGIKKFEKPLKGNLYKCGDKAKTPHYQSLFAIHTHKPDFHRPEFFGIFEL